jgi:hypothetical protein
MLHSEEQIDTDYTTPLIRDEYEYSKTVKLLNGATYNPTDLRGFFTHGIHNNLETFIEIIKDKYILQRNRKTSSVNTLTIKYSINTNIQDMDEGNKNEDEIKYYEDDYEDYV